jgi:aspartyl-tRNA(Asn)/glutamyl-tRNA(Gln) amidotransferase subunit A
MGMPESNSCRLVASAPPVNAVPAGGAVFSRRTFLDASLASVVGAIMGSQAGAKEAASTGADPRLAPSSEALAFLSIERASALVRTKKVSPVELTQACLSRIERLNPQLNAFITVTAESALAEARQAEVEILQHRWRGALHGIPIALKDLVDTAGVRTTAGSELFKDRIPAQDAEVVRRLKAAGAVFLGKLNMHEFAYGGSSAVSFFGPVRNPWNLAHSPGGSSGGSAAAVAAHLCYGAIGSDTGGSIREPAAYCGIVGLKPTYGRVSTAGAIPLSWSLDHLGPMTRTTVDAALMLQVLAGYDPRDNGSLDMSVPDYAAAMRSATSSLRVGIPRDFFFEGLDPDIQAAMEAALSDLKTLTRVQLDVAPLATDGSYASVMNPCIAILQAEAYAYHQDYVAKSPELYQKPTLERILAGAKVSTPTYIQSRRQMEQLRRSVSRGLDGVDLLITPTTPVLPFEIADLQSDPTTMRPKEVHMLRNTRPFDMFGAPTISVPCGFTRSGLPIGMQITGALGDEGTVLRLARAYEQATEWHKRQPIPEQKA